MDAMTELYKAIQAAILEMKAGNAGEFADQTAIPVDTTGSKSRRNDIIIPPIDVSNDGGME